MSNIIGYVVADRNKHNPDYPFIGLHWDSDVISKSFPDALELAKQLSKRTKREQFIYPVLEPIRYCEDGSEFQCQS